MMDNLKHEANNIRLTPAEKRQMRAAIFGVPSLHQPKHSPYFFFSYQFKMVMAGLLLVVFVGAGTAQAAQGSLPGDILYPIKVSINEKVEVALASSPAAKAVVEAGLATRRVEEAETLSSQGRLTASTSAELAVNINEHAKAAAKLAQSAETDAPGTEAEVQATLSSSLSAHSAILAAIGDKSTDGNKEQSAALSVRVLAQAGAGERLALAANQVPEQAQPKATAALSSSAPTLEASTSAATTTEDTSKNAGTQAAAGLEERAAQVLAAAQKQFNDTRTALGTTTAAVVEAQFKLADEAIAQGSLQVQNGEYQAAIGSFTKVLQLTARLSALLQAQQKFDGNILRTLIQNDKENHDGDGGDGN